MKLDPENNFMKSKKWLPHSHEDSADVALYLGTYEVYEQRDTVETVEQVKEELKKLGLDDNKMKYAMFCCVPHTKFFCRPLLTPRTFTQKRCYVYCLAVCSYLIHL